MSLEIRTFTFTVPAGTPIAVPVTMDCTLPARSIDQIVTDDESETWVLDNAITSGSWQLAGYNTGLNPHSVYVRFHVSLPPVPSQGPIGNVLPIAAISS